MINTRQLFTLTQRFHRSNGLLNHVQNFHSSRHVFAPINFKLADIGEGIAEVEVLQWFVKPGDTIKQFDKVCEVQSDKATVEITSRYDGVVESIGCEVGEMAQVGGTLLMLEGEGEAETPTPEKESAPERELNRTESMESTLYPPGKEPSSDPMARPAELLSSGKYGSLATPAVRRLVKEHNLDITMILGTGKDGRVLKSDVLTFIEKGGVQDTPEPTPEPTGSTTAPAASSPVRVTVRSGEDTVEKITGIKRQMVKSMNKALEIPHFNLMEEFEMSQLMELRAQLKPEAESRGIKLSFLPFLLKSASLGLLQYPVLNATVNDDCTEIVHRASHNISVAMDTPRGLLVPNVKDCQSKSVFDIAADLQRLQELGANNKLGEAELSGGTFSISNIGTIAGTYASPVIMSPQVAIGAIGRIQTVPRFDENDNVIKANVINVSWAADHRVIDGATMARFSNSMKSYVEQPVKMIADMV